MRGDSTAWRQISSKPARLRRQPAATPLDHRHRCRLPCPTPATGASCSNSPTTRFGCFEPNTASSRCLSSSRSVTTARRSTSSNVTDGSMRYSRVPTDFGAPLRRSNRVVLWCVSPTHRSQSLTRRPAGSGDSADCPAKSESLNLELFTRRFTSSHLPRRSRPSSPGGRPTEPHQFTTTTRSSALTAFASPLGLGPRSSRSIRRHRRSSLDHRADHERKRPSGW